MPTQNYAGFIATDTSDASVIWGVGITANAAINDALSCAEKAGAILSDLWTLPASETLIDAVAAGGGAIAWRETSDGIAVTLSEMRE